jgi:2-methylisocitrate lyase-like PEP mutase family enzyme
MKFGVMFANVLGFSQPDGAVAIAQAAEEAGFESLWTVEHIVVPAGYQCEYLIEVMRDTARDAGRDPDSIEITTGGGDVFGSGALDSVAKLADIGVERIVIPPLAFDAGGIHDALARYGDEVIAKVS